MTLRKDKNNLEHRTEKESKNILVSITKKLFGAETSYGIYHRNGWAFLALGYTSLYCFHPIVSVPIFGIAGYNFVQALRHKNELFEQDYEKFKQNHYEELRKKYKEEREKRRKNKSN